MYFSKTTSRKDSNVPALTSNFYDALLNANCFISTSMHKSKFWFHATYEDSKEEKEESLSEGKDPMSIKQAGVPGAGDK